MNLTNLTNKHYLSLAALMLLAHAVPLAVANSEITLTDDEKTFVQSYIQLGKKLAYLLIVSWIAWIAYLQFDYTWIQYISTIINSVVIIMIMLWIYAILYDTIIFVNNTVDIMTIKNLLKNHLFTWKK